MANAQTANMASFALPQNPALRLATQAGLAILGTLVLTVAAKTKVTLGVVDMNLGTLAVMAVGVAFGWRLALATLLLYMAEGATGLPVFQSTPEKGIGLAYMVGSTGGYLAGYVVLAAIAGWAADRGLDRNVFKLFGALMVGEVVMMAMGFGWLATLIGAEKAWAFGVQPFILVDLVKVALIAAAAPAVWSVVDAFRARS
ncbi:biotin transporter BioY [Escherichia coli]|nr:biotin transporter BioY [Salmonella enterica subsp. enterica serovar Paratyphi A]EFG2885632.1 biotin transporter BioY [Escherichia coli]